MSLSGKHSQRRERIRDRRSIREFLGRFDIDGGWSKLAQKTGLSERMLETSLSSFMLIRNECAHTGTATKIPTPSDIRAYCDLIEKISSGIAFLLKSI